MNQPHLPSIREPDTEPQPQFIAAIPEAGKAERPRYRLNLLLFVLTILTTSWAGAEWHRGFLGDSSLRMVHWVHGLSYSLVLLSILLAHEMGHYLACREYRIRATLPFLVPFLPVLFGTMGAVIRIKSPFLNRRQLFDVGIAGPLAGFVFLVPALMVGLQRSQAAPPLGAEGGLLMGVPLLFDWLKPYFYAGPASQLMSLHTIGLAAHFGMLATGLNLLPMGQLDGGHIVYALFGPRVHRIVSNITFLSLLGLSVLSWPVPAYLLFVILIRLIGFRHPAPVYGMAGRLGTARVCLALAALVIFLLTFVPFPFKWA